MVFVYRKKKLKTVQIVVVRNNVNKIHNSYFVYHVCIHNKNDGRTGELALFCVLRAACVCSLLPRDCLLPPTLYTIDFR